ncbi:helix-turn-helix domain-containing protein [Xanthomonas translucens]|uniref:Helix-turn-helix domain-containing protein n=1 Tax=Xanthomonas translucens pv. translucens TaxID=134875 RepID=A0ABW9L0M6_XANCT|nr:helix-turn-helix transcriptional regulator [Xanthomonas translucens]UII62127.1 helix-turn-helix transcriptional regulator [Xanthomonas translucens]
MDALSTGVDMTTQEKLIEAMKMAFPNESQAGLARKAGLGVQRYNNYVVGVRKMDVDAVIGCAQALGWDVRATVADHLLEVAESPREKALWKRVAATAAVFLCVIGMAENAAPARASESGSSGMYIM